MKLANKVFKLRYTTFIEIMAPCFSRRFLARCAPSFDRNISGWGLDFLWPSWAEASKAAIIAAVSVRHTRSQGDLYRLFAQQGINPEQELAELLLQEKLRPRQMTVGGVDVEGQVYTIRNGGRKKLIQNLIEGYLPEMADHSGHLYRAIEPLLVFGDEA